MSHLQTLDWQTWRAIRPERLPRVLCPDGQWRTFNQTGSGHGPGRSHLWKPHAHVAGQVSVAGRMVSGHLARNGEVLCFIVKPDGKNAGLLS